MAGMGRKARCGTPRTPRARHEWPQPWLDTGPSIPIVIDRPTQLQDNEDQPPAIPSTSRIFAPETLNVTSLDSVQARLPTTRVTNDCIVPQPSASTSAPTGSALTRSSATPLTSSGVAIHPVLGRFEQLPEKPLCCTTLRLTGRPQYILLGTKSGLFCVDLVPIGQTRAGRTLEQAKWYKVWSSPAVHKLEAVQSDAGVLLALIASAEDDAARSVRLFPLQAILNLCRYCSTAATTTDLRLPAFTAAEPSKKAAKRSSFFHKRTPSKLGDQFTATRADESDGEYIVVNGSRASAPANLR
jgi:hypothetical protein